MTMCHLSGKGSLKHNTVALADLYSCSCGL